MTPRQLQALDHVREVITDTGVSPSVRDVARVLGISISQAFETIKALIQAGALERGQEKTRSLRLPGQPDLRNSPTSALLAELDRRGVKALERGVAEPQDHGATCAADGCTIRLRPGMVMCRRHWFMLPEQLQRALRRSSAAGETARFDGLLATARGIVGIGDLRVRRA